MFEEPRFQLHVDVGDQAARLPRGAACKGMFFLDAIARARRVDSNFDPSRVAGVTPRKYVPVLDYPHAEWMRVAAAAAAIVRPGRVGDGLRELGRHTYDTIFESALGRVLFGPLGFDLGQVVAHVNLGYRLGLSFGKVSSERLDESHYRVTFRDMPTFLETYNVGVIEGAILHYRAEPQVLIELKDIGHAVMDVRWR